MFTTTRFIILVGMDFLLIKTLLLDMILKVENGIKSKLMGMYFQKLGVVMYLALEKKTICIFLEALQMTQKTLERLMM